MTRTSMILLVLSFLGLPTLAKDWEPPKVLASGEGIGGYDMHFGRLGDSVLLAWTADDPGQNRTLVYYEKADWVLNPVVGPIGINTAGNCGPSLFCQDSNGNLHFTWIDDRNFPPPFPQYEPFYKLISVEGETIVQDTPISEAGGSFGGRGTTNLVFGEDGFVHLLICSESQLIHKRIDLNGSFVDSQTIALPAGPHRLRFPRIFPKADGTALILYLDYMDDWNFYSRAYSARIDAQSNIIEGPIQISAPEETTYSWLTADKDSAGRIHVVLQEIPYQVPPPSRVSHLFSLVLDSSGVPIVPMWPVTSEAGPFLVHLSPHVVVDDFDRSHLFVVRIEYESALRQSQTLQKIMKFVLNPFSSEILSYSKVVEGGTTVTYPLFVRDSRGGWVGSYEDYGTSEYGPEIRLVRTNAGELCRDAGVHRMSVDDLRTLTVNGSTGDAGHEVEVSRGEPMTLAILCPESEFGTRFYVQARLGSPDSAAVSWIPGVGLNCFDLRDHASAQAVWNGLGGLYGMLGHSRVGQTPIPDPPSAPGIFFTVPPRATAHLPVGTEVTFQGIQSDRTARKGASPTNAVVVKIVE